MSPKPSSAQAPSRWWSLPLALVGAASLLPWLPSPASPAALAAAEAEVLKVVRAPMRHEMVLAGSHRLHTLIVGDGSKPPLVMLHGHGGGLAVYALNFDTLAAHYTLYALDLLGWGRSERPVFTGNTAQQAQQWWVDSVAAWRQALGLERFTLLGHSMGGFIATSYTLAHPATVSHLMLVDSAGMTRPVKLRNGLYFNLPPQRVVRLAGPLGPALVRTNRVEETGRGDFPGEVLTDYYYQLSAAPASGEVAFRKLLGIREWAIPLMDEAPRLTMPVTLIWGEQDELVSPDDARQLHARLPQSELFILPEAAHAPHSETPAAFHSALLGSRFRNG